MSFTAEVKDELSRVEAPTRAAELAQLSALVRICGTLSFHGSGRYSIRVATETGAVARTVIKLTHKLFDLETSLTVRRSVLHKTRNYLIEMPVQEGLDADLVRMGILTPGRGLTPGVPAALVSSPEARAAYVRGAFMAGGFIADPRGEFHLEIAVTGEDYAADLARLVGALGASARLNRRRGAFAIYLKSYDDVSALLRAMGARRMARFVEVARAKKSVKNDVNRRVNAEMANQARSTGAAAEQLAPSGSWGSPRCRRRCATSAAPAARTPSSASPPWARCSTRPPQSRPCTTASCASRPSWTRPRAAPRRAGGPDVALVRRPRPAAGNVFGPVFVTFRKVAAARGATAGPSSLGRPYGNILTSTEEIRAPAAEMPPHSD